MRSLWVLCILLALLVGLGAYQISEGFLSHNTVDDVQQLEDELAIQSSQVQTQKDGLRRMREALLQIRKEMDTDGTAITSTAQSQGFTLTNPHEWKKKRPPVCIQADCTACPVFVNDSISDQSMVRPNKSLGTKPKLGVTSTLTAPATTWNSVDSLPSPTMSDFAEAGLGN